MLWERDFMKDSYLSDHDMLERDFMKSSHKELFFFFFTWNIGKIRELERE